MPDKKKKKKKKDKKDKKEKKEKNQNRDRSKEMQIGEVYNENMSKSDASMAFGGEDQSQVNDDIDSVIQKTNNNLLAGSE